MELIWINVKIQFILFSKKKNTYSEILYIFLTRYCNLHDKAISWYLESPYISYMSLYVVNKNKATKEQI